MALLYSESGLGSTAPLAAEGLNLVLVFSCKNVPDVKLQATEGIKTAIQLRHIGLHTMRTKPTDVRQGTDCSSQQRHNIAQSSHALNAVSGAVSRIRDILTHCRHEVCVTVMKTLCGG